MTPARLTAKEIKFYSSLKRKKYRRLHNLFVAAGPHLAKAALESDWPIHKVIVESDMIDAALNWGAKESQLGLVQPNVLARIADTETPTGILAVVQTKDLSAEARRKLPTARRVVVANSIADPGNLGTMIRTAAAFDYDFFLCLGECADIYNPKTVRATQGAIFVIPIGAMRQASDFLALAKTRFSTVVFGADFKTAIEQCTPPPPPAAFVFGHETRGVDSAIVKAAVRQVRIRQSPRVESLNVAVAAGIGLWWGAKQSNKHRSIII